MQVVKPSLPLPLYVGLRLLAIGSVVALGIVAVREGLARLDPQQARPVAIEHVEPNSQTVLINGKRTEMRVGEDGVPEAHALEEMSLEEYAGMFPEEGDAPGFDIAGVPRHESLDRWMSFSDPAGAYQSVYYGGSEESEQALLAWYHSALGRSGWEVLAPIKERPAMISATGFGRLLLVQIRKQCSEGTCVSIMATDL